MGLDSRTLGSGPERKAATYLAEPPRFPALGSLDYGDLSLNLPLVGKVTHKCNVPLSLCVWFISLSKILSVFICVVACMRTLFLFIAINLPLWIYHILFIQLSVVHS